MDEFKKLMETTMKELEAPVGICFSKEPGLFGECSVILKGSCSAMFAGLCQLVPEVIKKMPKDRQKDVLEMLYIETLHELESSKE